MFRGKARKEIFRMSFALRVIHFAASSSPIRIVIQSLRSV